MAMDYRCRVDCHLITRERNFRIFTVRPSHVSEAANFATHDLASESSTWMKEWMNEFNLRKTIKFYNPSPLTLTIHCRVQYPLVYISERNGSESAAVANEVNLTAVWHAIIVLSQWHISEFHVHPFITYVAWHSFKTRPKKFINCIYKL